MTSLSPLKKHRFAVLAAPSLKVVECVCELIVPFLVKTIIDEGLSEDGSRYGDVGYIVSIALIVLALSVLGFLATMVTQYVASRVSTDYGYEYDHKQIIFPLFKCHILPCVNIFCISKFLRQ